MRNRKSIYTILTILIAVFFYYQNANSGEENKETQTDQDGVEETQVLVDKFNYLPTSTTNQIVKHKYYTLSYSEKHEQAEWVAYALKPSYLTISVRQKYVF